jgi:hypothetical protein
VSLEPPCLLWAEYDGKWELYMCFVPFGKLYCSVKEDGICMMVRSFWYNGTWRSRGHNGWSKLSRRTWKTKSRWWSKSCDEFRQSLIGVKILRGFGLLLVEPQQIYAEGSVGWGWGPGSIIIVAFQAWAQTEAQERGWYRSITRALRSPSKALIVRQQLVFKL